MDLVRLGIITPIGPNHRHSFESADQSIDDAWMHDKGPFTSILKIALPDEDGNIGRSARRNYGIEIAIKNQCEWIFFLDADDLMYPEAFKNFQKYSNTYDAVWGNICEMPYGDFSSLKIRESQLRETEIFSDLLSVDPFLTLQMGHFIKTHVAASVKFDETMNIGEDFNFYLRVCSRFKFKKCREIFFINQRGNHSQGPLSGSGQQWRINVEQEINKYIIR